MIGRGGVEKYRGRAKEFNDRGKRETSTGEERRNSMIGGGGREKYRGRVKEFNDRGRREREVQGKSEGIQ